MTAPFSLYHKTEQVSISADSSFLIISQRAGENNAAQPEQTSTHILPCPLVTKPATLVYNAHLKGGKNDIQKN